ncbi:Nup85 nucleoporin-domain-containing protein [Powellomyces hirtus]|nr:Nup85 nucleoporin-domain-containing protein [Powellomyces hirtus]
MQGQPQDDSVYATFAAKVSYAGLCKPGGIPELVTGTRTVRGSVSQDDQVVKLIKIADDLPPSRVSFVNETHGVFAALQFSIRQAGDAWRSVGGRRHTMLGFDEPPGGSGDARGHSHTMGTEIKKAVLRATVEYREKILSKFHEVADGSTPEALSENVILRTAHSAMQLLEVVHLKADLHVGPSQWDHVQEDYLSWLNAHYAEPRDEDFLPFKMSANPRGHPKYWPFVYQTLLRGHVLTVVSILKIHPDFRAQRIEAIGSNTGEKDVLIVKIIKLIETLPQPAGYETQHLFEGRRRRWKEDGCRLQSNVRNYTGQTRDLQEFSTVLAILNGDEKTILDLAQDWREAIAGLILFVHPSLKRHEIAELFDKVYVDVENSSIKELIEIAIIEGEFQRAIRHCTKQDWWLVAHFADLLHHLGVFDRDNVVTSLPGMVDKRDRPPQREWYLLNYSNTLLSHPTLWRVGLEYIASCPASGRQVLETMVTRIPLDGDMKTRKLIAFCKRSGLEGPRREIHRTIARTKYRAGRIGEALEHYIEAKDAPKVASLVDELIDAYLATADMTWSDVAARLSPTAVEWHVRLAMLVRYREFHELFTNSDYPAAGRQLVEIIGSAFGSNARLLPKRLIYTLLIDSLLLLEYEPAVVFGVKATNELMRCLEDITTSHRRKEYLGAWAAAKEGGNISEEAVAGAEAQLGVIRAALVKNLSRAYIRNVE